MATNDQILAVTVEARINKLEKEMKRASGIVGNNFNHMERRTKQAADRMERSLRNSTANINRLLGGIGVGIGLNEIRQLAERWTDLTSRVNIAAGSQEQGAEVMERISQIARRTYSDLGQTAETYISNSTALKELGYSTQAQLDYTEALNNALVVSGAKGNKAASVMNALSKAMALGQLRGEELNTVIQSGGRVAQALAEGLGVTTNELRTLGQQGKLTGEVVLKALTGQLGKLREEADSMPATISDAVVLLRNAMTEYVGKLNEARGITSIFSDGIILAADNIEHIANAAVTAGLAILTGYVPAIARATAAQVAMIATNPFLLLVSAIGAATFALSAFGDEIRPIEGEMANLQDYAGAAWDEISNAAISAGSKISETFLSAINWIVRALDGAEVSFSDLVNFAKQAANNLIGSFGLINDAILLTFTKLPAAVADAVLSGMNMLIAGVERGINTVIEAVNAAIDGLNTIGDKVGLTLGTVAPLTLQRIENAYAGAGAAAGAAYGEALRKASQDHIGNALATLREGANTRAAARADSAQPETSGQGGNVPAASGAGSSAGKGKAEKASEYERQVTRIQATIAALRMEAGVRREVTGSLEEQERAVERARMEHELLNAALASGQQDTPELRASIAALAQTYSEAALEVEALAQSQQDAARAAETFQAMEKDMMRGFVSDIAQGVTALDALGNALNRIADKLTDMALDGLFSGVPGGGIFGAIGGLLGFKRGGYTGDRGTSEVAGVVHGREFVMNARATEKHRPLLEAINRGVPGYRDGGFVSGKPSSRMAEAPIGSIAQSTVINVNTPVTVNANSGSPAQNEDLAKRVAQRIEASQRALIISEVQKQMRPGNMLNNRAR